MATHLSLGWLLASAVILDMFDVSLPREDSAGVTGALCAAAIVILGFGPALFVSVVSAAIAHLTRRGSDARDWRQY